MDKNRVLSLPRLWLIAVAIIGIGAFSLVSAQEQKEKCAGTDPNKAAAAEEKHEGKTIECLHKCTVCCVKKCQANMEDISTAKAAIKAAIEAIDKGDTKAAKSELEKAENLLKKVHECMEQTIGEMPCVNRRCPMMGNSIDMMSCPKERTCMYKGMKIGFCSQGCVAAWEKMTEAEKDAKLKEAGCSMTHKHKEGHKEMHKEKPM